MKSHMKKGDRVELQITDLTTGGEGIGHLNGNTFFVAGAVPGDTVLAEVTLPRKTYSFAKTREILVFSPDRVKPRCPVSSSCGGCQLQSFSYEAQLRWKKAQVCAALRRIGGFAVRGDAEDGTPPAEGMNGRTEEENVLRIDDVIGMEDPCRYRNKTQFPVANIAAGERPVLRGGSFRKRTVAAGYYAQKSHRIISCEDCLLSRTSHSKIRDLVLDFMEEYRISAYDETTGRGLVRHILIREGFATGEMLVCLVLNGAVLPSAAHLTERLRNAFPQIVSVCINVNRARNNVILGKEVLPLYGEPFLHDRIGDRTFRISPLSFFQINPVQTKKLYDTVKEFAALTGEETLLDLFCGIGTIGIYLADGARAVYGVEVIPDAVRDAAENAELNGITNAHFFVGQSEQLASKLPDADVIVIDPPRKGCEESLISALRESTAKRLIYVSCNPATLARDLKLLTEGGSGWQVERVQPVDLFPQTCHCEVAVRMIRDVP